MELDMEGQVIALKDAKKATRACDECKRRKGRCYGNSPCTWCATNNIECIFSSTAQKRGPKKKKRKENDVEVPPQLTLTLDKRELYLFNNLELGNYLEKYLKFVDPLYTMLGQWDRGSHLVHLVQPRSPAQFIIKYTACAIMARLMGQRERANSLVAEARGLAGKAFDDFSADGLVGFMLLGSYSNGVGDTRLNYHFFNIALSMFNLLKPSEVPANIRHFMTVCSVMSSETITGAEKLTTYFAKSQAIENQNYSQVLVAAIMRLRIKVYCHTKICEAEGMRMDIVAALASKVIYSEPQRKNLLADLQNCRKIAAMCTDIASDPNLSTSVRLLLTMFEILIEWRSGHTDTAVPMAVDFANEVTLENVRYGTPSKQRFDVEALLMISILLYEQQQPTLSVKLQKLGEAYASLLVDSFPALDSTSTTDNIIRYIRAAPLSSCWTKPEDSPNSTSTSSTSHPMLDDMLPTMINNVISLISQLIPMNSEKSFLPAQGLHMFYKTLSTFLPPTLSPFEIENETPFTPNIVSTSPQLLTFSVDNNNNNNNITTLSLSSNTRKPSMSPSNSFTDIVSAFNTAPSNIPSPSQFTPYSPPTSYSPPTYSPPSNSPSEIHYAYPDAVFDAKAHPFHFIDPTATYNNSNSNSNISNINNNSNISNTNSNINNNSNNSNNRNFNTPTNYLLANNFDFGAVPFLSSIPSPSSSASSSPLSSSPVSSPSSSPRNSATFLSSQPASITIENMNNNNSNKSKEEVSFIPLIDDPLRLAMNEPNQFNNDLSWLEECLRT